MDDVHLLVDESDDQRDTPYALLAIRVVPSSRKCSFISKLSCSICLDTTGQSKQFNLTPFTLCSIPYTGVTVLDIASFWGPAVINIKITQDNILNSRLISSYNMSLSDIIRRQSESNNKDEIYWGFIHTISASNKCLRNYELYVRFIEIRHCILSEKISSKNMMMKTELQLAASVGTGKIIARILFTLSRLGFLREALLLRYHHKYNVLDCALLAGNISTVKELLQRCGTYFFQDVQANTSSVLHHAVTGNNIVCVKLLLQFITKHGRSTLIAFDGSYSMLLTQLDEDGCSPFHLACKVGNHRMVKALLRAGSDPALINAKNGRTSLMYAAEAGHFDVVRILLAIVDMSSVSVSRWNETAIRPLCHPDVQDSQGKTALMLAADKGHSNVMAYLLRKGASALCFDHEGNLLIHYLARGGDIRVCESVLREEVTLYLANAEARRRSRYLEVPRRRQYMAARNNAGKTAVDIARQYKHVHIEAALVRSLRVYEEEVVVKEREDSSVSAAGADEDAMAVEDREGDMLDYDFAVVPKVVHSPQGYYSMVRSAAEEDERDELLESEGDVEYNDGKKAFEGIAKNSI